MKIGDRVRDCLFFDPFLGRGVGTVMEIRPMRGWPEGYFYAIVKWDNPVPKCNIFSITEYTSEVYMDDLEILESEE